MGEFLDPIAVFDPEIPAVPEELLQMQGGEPPAKRSRASSSTVSRPPSPTPSNLSLGEASKDMFEGASELLESDVDPDPVTRWIHSDGAKKKRALFICPADGCDKSGQNFHSMKSHMRQYHGHKYLLCHECGFRTYTTKGFKEHQKKRHSIPSAPAETWQVIGLLDTPQAAALEASLVVSPESEPKASPEASNK